MPLRKHMVDELTSCLMLIVEDQGQPRTTNEKETKIKETITYYFKAFVINMCGPCNIESVADGLALHLADDEIEEVVAKMQKKIEEERVPYPWPGLEEALENSYLEDTEKGIRENAPDFQVVKIDETDGWNKDFLKRHKIKKVSAVYLMDKQSVTHLCELAPSYCLYYLDCVAEHEDENEQITDEVYDDIMNTPVSDDPIYMHCSDLDKEGYETNTWRPDPLTTDMYEDEDAYKELFGQMIEEYHECPIW